MEKPSPSFWESGGWLNPLYWDNLRRSANTWVTATPLGAVRGFARHSGGLWLGSRCGLESVALAGASGFFGAVAGAVLRSAALAGVSGFFWLSGRWPWGQ